MKKLIIFIYLLLVLLMCGLYFLLDKENGDNSLGIKERTIKVDLKGAVASPGVKEIVYGMTIDELINTSGGLLENADTSTINLSKKLNDEDVVIIYTKDEIQNNDPKIIEKECICPIITTNNSCVKEEFINIVSSLKISLNSSSKEELMTLPGIGSSKAEAIIKYRENSLFNTIEDIMNVKGIGKSLFEKIKDYITI